MDLTPGDLAAELPPDQAQREIIHIDVDAFDASVEQRDHPELRGWHSRQTTRAGLGGAGELRGQSMDA